MGYVKTAFLTQPQVTTVCLKLPVEREEIVFPVWGADNPGRPDCNKG